MRTAVSILLVIILIFLTPILILLTAIKIAAPTTSELKLQLEQQGLYQSLSSQSLTLIKKLADSDDPQVDNMIESAYPTLETTLTKDYFQQKIEPLIESTANWMSNSSSPTPTLSFTDLKELLLEQNPDFQQELQSLIQTYQEELPELQQELNAQAQQSGETPITLPQIDPNLLDQDLSFDLEPALGWLRSIHTWTHEYYLVLLTIYFLLWLGILLLNLPRPFKPLIATSLSIGLSILPMAIGLATFTQTLASNTIISHLPPILAPIINTIVIPILNTASKLTIYSLVGLFTASVILFVLHRHTTKTTSKK
jgi:hypothetical protein